MRSKKPKVKNPSRSKPRTSQLRIIGGSLKRQSISFLDNKTDNDAGLRPTPDRLRETLFNWIAPYLYDANVLDVCAGSGALGFESLSRGAASATLIEPNQKQAHILFQNAQKLKLDNAVTIVDKTAQQVLPKIEQPPKPFDIIFLDPPYDLQLWLPLLELIKTNRLLKKEGLIYIEANCELDELELPAYLEQVKQAKVGQIYAGIFIANS